MELQRLMNIEYTGNGYYRNHLHEGISVTGRMQLQANMSVETPGPSENQFIVIRVHEDTDFAQACEVGLNLSLEQAEEFVTRLREEVSKAHRLIQECKGHETPNQNR
jgi:hypothetical protein